MEVRLAYGHDGLSVDLPDYTEVMRPRSVPGLPDETKAVLNALRHPISSAPLAEKVRNGDLVVIVHSDITRPMPNDRVLPILLAELEQAGITKSNITLLNALGTHRSQTNDELRAMLGGSIVDTYHCVQHDAFDDSSLVPLGDTSHGHPVRINKLYLEADVRILTGFIEPHFFAGFSGGPKAVLPALADAESVWSNHGRDMIAHPQATWGVTAGNPIWEEMRQVALQTDPTFLLNVSLNDTRQITGVFAGEMLSAHEAGIQFVRESAMVPVEEPFDIVITTNSGYPLDQNLYQSVKGMSAARQIVREGGAIVMATACNDGLPDHGGYAALLAASSSPQSVFDKLARPGFQEQDQWQVQIQALIQMWADVHIFSDGLTDEQIERSLLVPSASIEQTVSALESNYAPQARICVLPEGPQTMAFLMDGS